MRLNVRLSSEGDNIASLYSSYIPYHLGNTVIKEKPSILHALEIDYCMCGRGVFDS